MTSGMDWQKVKRLDAAIKPQPKPPKVHSDNPERLCRIKRRLNRPTKSTLSSTSDIGRKPYFVELHRLPKKRAETFKAMGFVRGPNGCWQLRVMGRDAAESLRIEFIRQFSYQASIRPVEEPR